MYYKNMELPKKPGIYLLRNKINNKIYIGKTNNILQRIREHKSAKYNSIIHKSIRKNGWDNFDVEVLEEFDYFDNDELLALETAFIDYFDSRNQDIGYNICLFANDTTGRKLSEEEKQKRREYRHTPEAKAKMSLQRSGSKHYRYGKTWDLSYFHKPVIQIDKNNKNVVNIFKSVTEAAKNVSATTSQISRVCKGEMGQSHGFIWKYVKDYYQIT